MSIGLYIVQVTSRNHVREMATDEAIKLLIQIYDLAKEELGQRQQILVGKISSDSISEAALLRLSGDKGLGDYFLRKICSEANIANETLSLVIDCVSTIVRKGGKVPKRLEPFYEGMGVYVSDFSA